MSVPSDCRTVFAPPAAKATGSPLESPDIIFPLARPAILANETALSAIIAVATVLYVMSVPSDCKTVFAPPAANATGSPDESPDMIFPLAKPAILAKVTALSAKCSGSIEAFTYWSESIEFAAIPAFIIPVNPEPSPINVPDADTSNRLAFDPDTITFFHVAILFFFYLIIYLLYIYWG